jgi:exodeoxyribonuclease VII large subunit
VFTVGEVIRYLGDVLADDVVLAGLWVQGEISNLSHSTAGHTYFTLKDEECQLKSVAFRGSSIHKAVLRGLKNGDWVLAHGRIGVYEAQGSVQLYVDHVQPAGLGILQQRFDELCAKLRAEGLFDESRKRPIPQFPHRVGVVTSPQAAALQDICRILAQRFPAVEVVLAPTLVQGVEAPAQIVAAIDHLSEHEDVDVIVVARGGGSMEDLWAFNDESVARAIARARVPVVTGIGHETDFTVADFVADLRAPTPSGAAVAVVPDRETLLAQVEAYREDLGTAIMDRLDADAKSVFIARDELVRRNPQRRIMQWRQHLDEVLQVLAERSARHVQMKRERLSGRRAELTLLHPTAALQRGYALITDSTGMIIRSAAGLDVGDPIRLRMRDGLVSATVDDVVKPAGGKLPA